MRDITSSSFSDIERSLKKKRFLLGPSKMLLKNTRSVQDVSRKEEFDRQIT